MTIKIGIYDHALGESITRDATPEEIAELETLRQNAEAAKSAAQAEILAKKTALADKLGITLEEVELLGK